MAMKPRPPTVSPWVGRRPRRVTQCGLMGEVGEARGQMRGRPLARGWLLALVVISVSCGLLAMHALGALGHHGAGPAAESPGEAGTTAVVAPHTSSPGSDAGGSSVHGGVTDTGGPVLQVRGCNDGCEVGRVVAICLAVLSGLYLLARLARRPRPVANDRAGTWRPVLPLPGVGAFTPSGPQLLNLLCVNRT